jgi:GrpB-like predicted nucleotidyltransferase (UPF0157 family)
MGRVGRRRNRHYLAFRDHLRESADLRARYASLKLKLAEDFPDDRRQYTAGKSDFIRSYLAGFRAYKTTETPHP